MRIWYKSAAEKHHKCKITNINNMRQIKNEVFKSEIYFYMPVSQTLLYFI